MYTIWDAFQAFLFGIWYLVLDPMFTFITNFWTAIFSAIPLSAIQFAIGIICYSIMFFLEWQINKLDEGRKKLAWKICYYSFAVFMILFTLWRFGIIVMIEDKATAETYSSYFLNILYLFMAIILIVSFYRKTPWLKKFLIGFLWTCLLLLTFLICPLTGESTLSDNTLYQILTIGFIFAIPTGMLEYQKQKSSGV